jgi:SPP1 family phage portal protein
MQLNGRKVIYSPYEEVNDDNIVEILSTAYPLHVENQTQINYLFNYYKGIQPIIERTKKIRSEINNKIVENHANAIVQFKTGYLLEKPIQYVARKEEVDDESINYLNDCMILENKESKDKKLANHQAICGTAYRLALPNKEFSMGVNSPFNIFTTNPKYSFVVYSTGIGNKPLVGVVFYTRKTQAGKDEIVLQAYTDKYLYEYVVGESVYRNKENHIYGEIPLIEYPYNEERIGAFEVVIDLLNAINLVQSNRLDGVEQFIQALLIFKNVDITKEDLLKLIELGAIKIKDDGEGVEANVEYLTQELNQEQVQKLKDDLLEVVYKIVGMPLGKGGSTGNSQGAVIMRDGWSSVEAKAQETELMFKSSEREFLKLALKYTRILTARKYEINLGDLDIKFTRRNYENTYQKSLILDVMLKNPKIAPRLAFIVCGLFSDPEQAYAESEQYYQEHLNEEATKQETTPTQTEVMVNEN